MTHPPVPPPGPRSAGWRRLRRFTAAGLLLGAAGWLLWQPALRAVARGWVVEQAVEPADAIVVAATAPPVLLNTAREWFQGGRAPRLVLLVNESRPTDRAGITPPAHVNRQNELRAAGLPAEALVLVGHELANLNEGLIALRAWAQSNRVQRVLLPVEPFATRRVARLGRRVLAPAGVQAIVVPVPMPDYTVDEWWRKEAGLIAFENEWVMSAYYWLRY